MRIDVTSRSAVVLPEELCLELGIRDGDALDAKVEAGRIVVTPERKRTYELLIITDPLTGLPVLTGGEGAPVLTSKEVEEMLADFP